MIEHESEYRLTLQFSLRYGDPSEWAIRQLGLGVNLQRRFARLHAKEVHGDDVANGELSKPVRSPLRPQTALN